MEPGNSHSNPDDRSSIVKNTLYPPQTRETPTGLAPDLSTETPQRLPYIPSPQSKRSLSEIQPQAPQQHEVHSSLLERSVRQRVHNQYNPNLLDLQQHGDASPSPKQMGGNQPPQQQTHYAPPLSQQPQHRLSPLLVDDDDKNVNQSRIISQGKAICPSPGSNLTPSTTTILSAAQKAKQALINAAKAIIELKMDVAKDLLMKLSTEFADPFGTPEMRIVHYLVAALRSLIEPAPYQEMFLNPLGKEHLEATHLLYDRSVCFKFGFMFSNLTIVKAAMESQLYENNPKIKIRLIDFDIGNRDNYKHILTAIDSLRHGKSALLKVTTFMDFSLQDNERLKSIFEDVNQHAQRLGIGLQFQPSALKIDNLSRQSLSIEMDEFLAVNFPFLLHRMADESVLLENPRDALLRSIKALSPNIVTLVEQELNTNTTPFVARLEQVYDHYSVLLDTIESLTQSDHRVKIEALLRQKLANSVVGEGLQRTERCEVFTKWKARMNMAGFRMRHMSHYTVLAMRVNISTMNRRNPGFMIKEENGVIELYKNGKKLIVGSAWI